MPAEGWFIGNVSARSFNKEGWFMGKRIRLEIALGYAAQAKLRTKRRKEISEILKILE